MPWMRWKDGRHVLHCCCEAEDEDDAQVAEEEEDEASTSQDGRGWLTC